MGILRALEVTHVYFGTNLQLFVCRLEGGGGGSHFGNQFLIGSYCMLRRDCEMLSETGSCLALDKLMGHCPLCPCKIVYSGLRLGSAPHVVPHDPL